MKEINITFTLQKYTWEELTESDKILCQKARDAGKRSYAPYSTFHVGAAVQLANGEIINGSNQENAAYPSGLCAERTALFYAGATYPDQAVVAIAIAAETKGKQIAKITPCGACRQVMLETEARGKTKMRVLMCGRDEILICSDVESLLPLSFMPSSLEG